MQAESIKRVKYIGKCQTLDIHVDNNHHLYYANGIVTHNSHGIEYAKNSYHSMYAKVHFPTEFFTSWLTYASEKPDSKAEIASLVNDARLREINIRTPDLRQMNADFEIIGKKEIVFGLSHIKGIGNSAVESIKENLKDTKSFVSFLKSIKKIKKNVAESLIKSGACDYYRISRSQMLRTLYAIYGRKEKDTEDQLPEMKPLTVPELNHFISKVDEIGIVNALSSIVDNEICIKKRVPTIQAKIKYLEEVKSDTNTQKALWEKLYLGIALSTSATEDYEKIEANTMTCKQAYRAPAKTKVVLHAFCDEIKVKRTGEKSKTPGREYAYLTLSDNTASLNYVVLWPEMYDKFKDQLFESSVITVYGRKDSWAGKDQIVVNNLVTIG